MKTKSFSYDENLFPVVHEAVKAQSKNSEFSAYIRRLIEEDMKKSEGPRVADQLAQIIGMLKGGILTIDSERIEDIDDDLYNDLLNQMG